MRGATGFPFTTPVAGEDAYVFSNIEVAYRDRPSRDTSFVSFDIAWGTEEWPGIYECSWTVYGKDGKVVGEVTDAVPLIRHRRSAPGLVEYVRVSGRPDHAEIGCHGSRLDSPGGDFARATPAPDTHPYPRGAFESCPDLEGTVRVTSSDAKGAWRVALRFDAAVVHHRVDTIERLADRSVSAPATHPWASTLEVNEWARITRSEPATSDDMVIFGCGRKVARRSWAVTVSDKNQFHSASMGSATFYLVRRAEGWRVWGSY